MYRKSLKMTTPQYRERKEIYEELGYQEVRRSEKGFYTYVTYEIDENIPHYEELRQFEKRLFRKGPTFLPIIILVALAFILLSVFVIRLAQSRKDGDFDLIANSLGFLLPAFSFLVLDVIYTYFYYSINKKIIEEGYHSKSLILEGIKEIKNK